MDFKIYLDFVVPKGKTPGFTLQSNPDVESFTHNAAFLSACFI